MQQKKTKLEMSNRYLVERKNPINLLPCDGLRDGDLSLVLVAGHDLRRIAPQLVIVEWSAENQAIKSPEVSGLWHSLSIACDTN